MAAIRGLGRIATPEARHALAEAAATHPEPLTRRRAAAEVEILTGRATPSREAPGHAKGAQDRE